MRPRGSWLLLVLALACCKREDMYVQQRAVSWGAFWFLPHRMTMQEPVPGTLARNAPDAAVPEPQAITTDLLSRGQQQFNINCSPCHGMAGDGEGMIVQRGFPKPPALFQDHLLHVHAQHFYDVITHGAGVMYSYADRVSPADRWAIVAYIRALQRSQRTKVADLSDADKAKLASAQQ